MVMVMVMVMLVWWCGVVWCDREEREEARLSDGNSDIQS